MTDKKKILIYWLVVGMLEIISLLLAIFCIIKFVPQDNYLTGLAFFSIGICVLSGILMVFHIEKSFNWFYKKAQSAAMHAIPEFFSTSLFLLKKEKAYKRLNLITLILQGINIVLQIVLLVIWCICNEKGRRRNPATFCHKSKRLTKPTFSYIIMVISLREENLLSH